MNLKGENIIFVAHCVIKLLNQENTDLKNNIIMH